MVRSFLRVWHAIPLGSALLLLLTSLTVAVVTIQRMRGSIAWVNHSYYVIAEVHRTVALLKDAETEQRAFLLTSNDAYLHRVDELLDQLGQGLENLHTIVIDNRTQADRATALRRAIQRRADELREATRLRAVQGAAAAQRLIEQESSLQLMLQIGELERQMTADEFVLLDGREQQMHLEMRIAGVTIVVSGAVALGLAMNAFLVLRRGMKALEREADLLREKERAERADREKSDFLANMSHEIRTPMNAVLGFAELLRAMATTPKQLQYVEAINTSGRALLSLINDILDLSKIEAGRFELTLRPTSIRAVLESIRTIFSQQAADRGLQLVFEVDGTVPPAVLFDATRLRQILFNVVGNALKFTPQGSITVRAWTRLSEHDETSVTLFLSVTDTGIGIAAEHQDMIFEPFRQVRTPTLRVYGGTGLGLTITRRLTKMLNGCIRLESERGRGTTFTFEFSAVAISAALPEEELAPTPDQNFDVIRPSLILVADDIPLNRELLAGYFENTHHRLLQASSGHEALAMTRQHHPDVLLLDLRMPDLDGRSVMAELRETPELADIPVVAITASSMLAEEQDLRRMFAGFIRKPFTRATLFRELVRLLPADEHAEAVSPAAEVPPAEAPEKFAPEAAAEPANPVAWREFVTYLRALERETWPTLSKSMGYRETETFARELADAAARAECEAVHRFANALLAQVRAFQFSAQEKSLKSFPELVHRIVTEPQITAS